MQELSSLNNIASFTARTQVAVNNGFTITVLNSDGKPVVYSGAAASTITFTLSNLTGQDIVFTSTDISSAFAVFMPNYFTLDDLKKMKISLAGWSFSVDEDDVVLMLTYSGGANFTWADGKPFSFDVTGVQTNVQPSQGKGNAQVNAINFPGGVQMQVSAPLNVMNKPVPGNGDLTKTLQLTLDSQGGVLVSPTGDPLQNTIFLNIKNIGDKPLYSGTNMWKGSPTVTVSFVYGTSIGSLAPADKSNTGPVSGSAWNIVANIPYAPPQNIWHTTNPDKTSTAPTPFWILNPTNLNKGMIGIGENANITFSFSNIISFTPPGHTQMMVFLTGFMKDDNTPYDDAVFVLDIAKQNAPPTRGLINFFSPTPIFQVTSPKTPINIPLRWAMFDVAKATLICSYPGIPPVAFPYPNPATIGYDSTQITIPGITQSAVVSITLQAFNAMDGFLNSMQFTAFLQANMFVDPRDGNVYPAIQIGKRFWMTMNLDFQPPQGSGTYGPEADFGRLYTWQAALPTQTLNGWRLPTKNDWTDLLNTYNYDQLYKGGSTGFNALLNGSLSSNGSTNGDFGTYGYYWSAENNNGNVDYVSFSSRSKTAVYVKGDNIMPASNFISVRLVKDIG